MTTMTDEMFRRVLSQFLEKYWGAFHEALETQSVTPRRLAGSLLQTLLAEHRAFEAVYVGPATSALNGLGAIWHSLEVSRHEWPDPGLTHDDVVKAKRLFLEIYDSLLRQGETFSVTRRDVVEHAPHGTPKEPLRADAAR